MASSRAARPRCIVATGATRLHAGIRRNWREMLLVRHRPQVPAACRLRPGLAKHPDRRHGRRQRWPRGLGLRACTELSRPAGKKPGEGPNRSSAWPTPAPSSSAAAPPSARAPSGVPSALWERRGPSPPGADRSLPTKASRSRPARAAAEPAQVRASPPASEHASRPGSAAYPSASRPAPPRVVRDPRSRPSPRRASGRRRESYRSRCPGRAVRRG